MKRVQILLSTYNGETHLREQLDSYLALNGFENVSPAYQMIKALVNNVEDLHLDKEHTMIISPDEGGMSRCMLYSNYLGLDLGMFYKRRDYSRIVDGRNPILEHQFLGSNIEGKDVMIIDDMISSGESMLDVSTKLKELGANRVFIFSAFGLFNAGLENFDKAYRDGLFDKVFTTNLVYRMPELKKRDWYCEVDLSKYLSYIIDTLNHDKSVSKLLNPAEKIDAILTSKGYK